MIGGEGESVVVGKKRGGKKKKERRNGTRSGRESEAAKRSGGWSASTSSALKITKRVLRGIKVGNRAAAPVECLSRLSPVRATGGATGGFVLFLPSSLTLLLAPHDSRHRECLPRSSLLPSSVFFTFAFPLLPSSAARGCDLKCKLKYSKVGVVVFVQIDSILMEWLLSHQRGAGEKIRAASLSLFLLSLHNGEEKGKRRGEVKQRTLSVREK